MVFDTANFTWIPLSAVSSAQAEIALAELDDLLGLGRLDRAVEHYRELCQSYLEETVFQARLERARDAEELRRAEREAALVAQERSTLRERVELHLEQGRFEVADDLYREHCSDWWPQPDYSALRTQAVHTQTLIQAYPSSSLSELDRLYAAWNPQDLSPYEFAQLKLPKLRLRLARLGMPLDDEQLLACARPERHHLIRARAGSGKTRTLAAHAALVLHDEALEADQVLILAFNKKAAREIGDRVRGAASIPEFRNARTFHSLAWQLADHAGRELIFDDGNLAPSRRKQTGYVERTIESIMNPAFREILYEFFRRELEQLDRLGSSLSKEEYIAFRRSIADYTLGGDTVKSNGEKFIADFLFEHGVDYTYEKVYSWDKQDRLRGSPYRPDFSIINGGRDFILEHWAINPNDPSAEVPAWWDTSTRDYRDQIQAKREFWAKRGIQLLETHAGMLSGGREAFEANLQALLENIGIRCRTLNHAELVRRVAEAPRSVSRIAELFMQFISRAKKRGWSVDDAAAIIRDAPDPEARNRVFHELAVRAFAAYEGRLVEQSAMDFDDLLISAAETIHREGGAARLQLDRNSSIALRDLRWILVDEFQDFSELYYRLIVAMIEANPAIRVVGVGDDWQAINGFAGAQLTFFNRFGDYFPGAGESTVSTNWRSGRAIVGSGNQVMMGRGEPALANHDFDGAIDVVAIDKIWLEDGSAYLEVATTVRDDGRRIVNWELARALKGCADYIAASVHVMQGRRWIPRVLVLARTGRAYGVTLEDFGRRLELALRQDPNLQDLANDFAVGKHVSGQDDSTALIEVMTAHKAKGKEADTVIVLDATLGQFPKVHADNQLFGPFGVTVEDVLVEERRLFYVAVTRAEARLMLLTETGKESPYLKELVPPKRAARPGASDSRTMLGDFATRVRDRLNAGNQIELIRNNISDRVLAAWDDLRFADWGIPIVGYTSPEGLYAELAWPEVAPPTVVLTMLQSKHAKRWRELGWEIYS